MTANEIDFRTIKDFPIIKYSGIYDHEALLKRLREAIIEQGFSDFNEASLKYKVPKPTGAEIEFDWWAKRKVNSYIQYFVDVFMKFWDVHDVEVVKDGKKHKMQSGRFQIELSGRCQLDFSNRFGGSKFMQALQKFFERHIIYKDIGGVHADKLYYRIYKIHNIIKEQLDMYTKGNAYDSMW